MIKQFFVDLYRSVLKHNVGSLAAIIAFFGFSSLLPLLACVLFLISVVVPEVFVESFIQHLLQSYVPALPFGESFASDTIQQLLNYRTHLSVLGIIGLLWGSIGGFVNLQQILDTIFEVRHRRSFWKQYVMGFLMMAILLAIAMASSIISAVAAAALPQFLPAHIANWVVLPFVQLVGHVTFVIVLLITCFWCYRILPSRKIRLMPSLAGALVTTGVIYISRWLFVIYTHHLGNYHLMYGALTFVMLLLFWSYIACVILLIGAEVSVTLDNLIARPTPRTYSHTGSNVTSGLWRVRDRQR